GRGWGQFLPTLTLIVGYSSRADNRSRAICLGKSGKMDGLCGTRPPCAAVSVTMPGIRVVRPLPPLRMAMPPEPLLQSQVPGIPCRRGKVRDVYDLGDRLVIVATDRLSAFDWVLPTAIPDKGRVLTALTLFWLDFLRVPNHLMSTDAQAMGNP